MIKHRLTRHLTAIIIAKLIILTAIWAVFFRTPPVDTQAHLFPAPPAHGDRP
ncbi:MAG: cytochrome oxidase putative small subunit CydP [Sulfuricaulis sp.]